MFLIRNKINPALFTDNLPSNDELQNSDLIKFGPHDQILIGHNVAFDRSKVAEEYQIRSKKIFLDTMSFHAGPDSFFRA